MPDDDMTECELCGECFSEEEITSTFYWTVCDQCREDQEDNNWVVPHDAPWR